MGREFSPHARVTHRPNWNNGVGWLLRGSDKTRVEHTNAASRAGRSKFDFRPHGECGGATTRV
ncbi:hypothetical protein E2C01_005217 [Portunus trituberculatus]|uniref:Uncharacterized protein n=1 Tax=Portunus trituberculatus TaxID=210409 RepID=A0A5B7CSS2_PORTR|nr:hypothetical protein [Portunus trituberculatus]